MLAPALSAEVIDDFEWSATPPEPVINGPGWTRALSSKPGAEVVTFDGGTRLRIPGSTSSGYANHTKAASIPNNSTGELAFRFLLPTGYVGDVTVGLANASASSAGSNLAQVMAGAIRFTQVGSISTFDGSTARTFDQGIQAGT